MKPQVVICCAEEDEPVLAPVVSQLISDGLAPEVVAGLELDPFRLGRIIDEQGAASLYVFFESERFRPRVIRQLEGICGARRGPEDRTLTLALGLDPLSLAAIILEECSKSAPRPVPRESKALRRDVVKVHAGLASAVDMVREEAIPGAIPQLVDDDFVPIGAGPSPAHRQQHAAGDAALPGARPRDTAGDGSLDSRGRQSLDRARAEADGARGEAEDFDLDFSEEAADSHPDEELLEHGRDSTLTGAPVAPARRWAPLPRWLPLVGVGLAVVALGLGAWSTWGGNDEAAAASRGAPASAEADPSETSRPAEDEDGRSHVGGGPSVSDTAPATADAGAAKESAYADEPSPARDEVPATRAPAAVAEAVRRGELRVLDLMYVVPPDAQRRAHDEAASHCGGLTVAGMVGFRLPNGDELKLVRHSHMLEKGRYWSSALKSEGFAYIIDTAAGSELISARRNVPDARALCVRNR